jgi:hypothetical protein
MPDVQLFHAASRRFVLDYRQERIQVADFAPILPDVRTRVVCASLFHPYHSVKSV